MASGKTREAMSRGPFTSAEELSQKQTAESSAVQALLAEATRAHQAGQLEEAKQLYLKVLAMDVKNEASLYGLARIASHFGNDEIAVRMIRRAIALNDTNADYHAALGAALLLLERFEEAIAAYGAALAIRPGDEQIYLRLGNVFLRAGRPDEARARYEDALALRPNYADAYNNLGNLLLQEGRLDEARAEYERALLLQPNLLGARLNLGVVLRNQGKLREARGEFERVLRENPDDADAHWNHSLLELTEGRYAEGWREYEARQLRRENRPRNFGRPQWRGEPLNGGRILLYCEQGLGDTLQFLRYVPMVQAAGGMVLLDVLPPLRRLAAALPGIASVTSPGEDPPPFAWQCPLMSLPLAFGTTVETIPAKTPYLTVPEAALEAADKLAWPDELRVGLVWSGNPRYRNDIFRSLPLQLLEPLLRLDGVRFFSLQMGAAAAELTSAGGRITDLQGAIQDMADTAAILTHLDVVISVDTAVAHLAGSLARRVWLLLPFASDWRWLSEREDSPWYPTMRLFRQERFGAWGPVVERIRAELEGLGGERSAG